MSKAICVYCASSRELTSVYVETARALGRAMLDRGHSLVYGGGNIGLMGELARTIQEGGGRIVGVIPRALRDLELAFEAVEELIVTETMHERKATMAARADAFIALPGGFGTFEEICEAIAHRQLGLHPKPCVILNVNGYYDPLIGQFERAFREGFVSERFRENYSVARSVADALDLVE
ncbi:TIGR00730 family Rossman fold protein [Candidatus Sumerlaeota bacterium]|nr:TIGR00730 family Rossman fold protein [Candidatus Sumerlaeota bacterium]